MVCMAWKDLGQTRFLLGSTAFLKVFPLFSIAFFDVPVLSSLTIAVLLAVGGSFLQFASSERVWQGAPSPRWQLKRHPDPSKVMGTALGALSACGNCCQAFPRWFGCRVPLPFDGHARSEQLPGVKKILVAEKRQASRLQRLTICKVMSVFPARSSQCRVVWPADVNRRAASLQAPHPPGCIALV